MTKYDQSTIPFSSQTGEALLQDWQAAGLAKSSVFKPLIATIEQGRIVKTMGQLSQDDQNSLKKVIQTILNIMS